MRALSAALFAGLIFITIGWAGVASAQSVPADIVRSPILVIDSEQLYAQSAFGKRAARDQEVLTQALVAENVVMEQELATQEQELTTLRATTEPAAFRELADAFDTKVQAARARQLGRTQALAVLLEQQRSIFLQAAGPVIENLMREAGAAVLLEQRDTLFSADAVDITTIALLRIDASLGEGTPLTELPDAPEQ